MMGGARATQLTTFAIEDTDGLTHFTPEAKEQAAAGPISANQQKEGYNGGGFDKVQQQGDDFSLKTGAAVKAIIDKRREEEMMTPEERDGSPPAMFSWRGRIHHLRRIDGPERISPEWWRQDRNWAGGARDYWRIEDAEGHRLWLFREGGGVEESRWFVHGFFA